MKFTLYLLAMQVHLMFADNIIGPNSDNGLYGKLFVLSFLANQNIPP